MSDRYDIYAEAGVTLQLSVQWKDSDGDAINLAGYTAAMQVRRTVDEDPLVSLTQSSGLAITANTGTIAITVAASTMDDLEEGRYLYDLDVTSGSGIVTRLLRGRFFVGREVTR